MFLGVDHIGVGVTDVERSVQFYGELGLTDVRFDYEGPLPGLEQVSGRSGVEARVVMLSPGRPSPVGLGSVKLVKVTDSPAPPMPDGMAWGEPGICEVCVHARGQEEVYRRIVGQHPGAELMEPNEAELPPYDTPVALSYVADPDRGKIELIEWPSLIDGWPGDQGAEGVNHVAFGVADIEETKAFYEQLGFTGLLFESDGYFEPMHPWYPGEAPRQRMMLLTNPHGAGMEPVQHFPPSPDMRGEWGHVGPFEFAIGVRNIDRSVEVLEAAGVQLRGEVATIDVGSGTMSYAYFQDPDDLFVCLTEMRC